MNASSSNNAQAGGVGNAISVQQITSTMLRIVKADLAHLAFIQQGDKDWNHADDDVGRTVRLALATVERMAVQAFPESAEFSNQWFLVLAPLTLACKVFSRPDSFYGTTLAALEASFIPYADIVDFVAGEAA